ncbi:hypothetical protein WN943_016403 [Citrus x changshan-huyou]
MPSCCMISHYLIHKYQVQKELLKEGRKELINSQEQSTLRNENVIDLCDTQDCLQEMV